MLKFTSIVGYTSCGPTYVESFLTIFGQCINVLNYNILDKKVTENYYFFISLPEIVSKGDLKFMAKKKWVKGNLRAK